MTRDRYRRTKIACYTGYFVQAIVNNLSPLLFALYQRDFSVSYGSISFLVLLNFGVQLITDITSTLFVDRIGYRKSLSLAFLSSAAGLALLPILPRLIPPVAGLSAATVLMGAGSGLIEVLVSPIVENLPGDKKEASMSLLHSFFSIGQVVTVIVTTLILRFTGGWQWAPLFWMLVPLFNFLNFLTVPIRQPPAQPHGTVRGLLKNRTFVTLIVMMAAGGASEITLAQWMSLFTEQGLGLPKALGDLFGLCGFALFMWLGRVGYGLWGHKIPIRKALIVCGGVGCGAYLLAALSPLPALSLVGCMLCGLAASLMWPGCLSLAAKKLGGHTATFALLAMGGDAGCSVGPWLAGIIASVTGSLRPGLCVGAIFPLILAIGAWTVKEK